MKTRFSDPIKAQEAIQNIKNCSSLQVIKGNDGAPDENGSTIHEEVQHAIWWLLERYPSPNDSSIQNLKSVNQSIGEYVLWHGENKKLTDLVAINMVTINGIETWVVQDFEKGPKESKWFKGKSCESQKALHHAMLKFANIKITDVDPEKNRDIDAHEVRYLIREIITGLKGKTKWEEKKTGDEIEVTHTIAVDQECFIGKSTTSGNPKTEKSREQGMKMTKQRASVEARKLAEKKFFNAFFGVDGVKEFTVDELGRPVEAN